MKHLLATLLILCMSQMGLLAAVTEEEQRAAQEVYAMYKMPQNVYDSLLNIYELRNKPANELTESEQAQLAKYRDNTQGLIVVAFVKPGCPYCERILAAIAKEKEGTSFLKDLKNNHIAFYVVKESAEYRKQQTKNLTDKNLVTLFPQLFIFKNGQRLKAHLEGYYPDELPRFLSYLISINQ